MILQDLLDILTSRDVDNGRRGNSRVWLGHDAEVAVVVVVLRV